MIDDVTIDDAANDVPCLSPDRLTANVTTRNAVLSWDGTGTFDVMYKSVSDADWGDTVRVMETRPLSKDKRWRLVEIMERAK